MDSDAAIDNGASVSPRGIRFGMVDLLIAVGLVASIFGWYRWFGVAAAFFPGVASASAFIGWRLRPKVNHAWTTVPIICFSIATMRLALQGAYDDVNRSVCIGHLKQIGLALLNYESAERGLPTAQMRDANGLPLHSWRTATLRYMEFDDVHRQVNWDEPWDSLANRKLEGATEMYRCPGESDEVPTTWTNYLAIVGTPSVWPDRGSGEAWRASQNSILVIESANTGIHWMEPRDLHVTQMAPWLNAKSGQGPSSRHGAGVNVIFTDGRVDTLTPETDPAVLRAMLNGE